MTRAVPAASESGLLRRGSCTSPAVNVILFQASAENKEPTCATQKAINRPRAPVAALRAGRKDRSGLTVTVFCGVQKLEKLAWMTSAFRPINKPIRIRASKDSVLAEVKMFWMSLPTCRPRVLIKVSRTTRSMATNCWTERLMASVEERLMGAMIQEVGENAG